MRRFFSILVFGFLGTLGYPIITWAQTPEPEQPIEEAANARAQYAIATRAESEGNSKRSLAAYQTVVRRFPHSEYAETAQFKVGQLQEAAGDFQRAFKSYQKLIKDYPNSTQFNPAIDAQFKIATLFLEGEKQRLLGVPTLPSLDKAREMFESIIQSAPFSSQAPLAQFNIGQTYERQGNVAKAVEAYRTVIERYPNSDVADDAHYQIGYAYLMQARKGSYDQTTAERARETFEDFLMRYPNSEKVPQAEENLKLLTTQQTNGALDIAKFYDKQKNYKAAIVYYNEVLRQQPNSESSEYATNRIEEIRSLVGDDELRFGSERSETGEMAQTRRRFQSQVDTASRADYAGPAAPVIPDELPPARPQMRTSPGDMIPLPPIEPDLPDGNLNVPEEDLTVPVPEVPETSSQPAEKTDSPAGEASKPVATPAEIQE